MTSDPEVDEFLQRATEDPESVDVDRLRELLAAEDGAVRNDAVLVASRLAAANPADGARIVPELVDVLDDPLVLARLRAVKALAAVADEHADALAAHVGDISMAMSPDVRMDPGGQLVEFDSPSAAQGVDELQRESRQREAVREALADAVVDLADAEPERVADAIPELTEHFDDPNPTVRGAIVDAVANVAIDNPNRATPAVEGLLDLLEDDDPSVRLRAVRAIGLIEADRAVHRLDRLAAEDSDEDVSELASEIARYLEELD